MQEFFTKAIVLDRADSGEADARVTLYTQARGRITARAKSVRKAGSKLAAHLQPLTAIDARIIEASGFQIVDALTTGKFQHTTALVQLMRLIKELTADDHRDDALWQRLTSTGLQGAGILKSLGLDPQHAACHECEEKNPRYFLASNLHYVCGRCIKTTGGREYSFELSTG